MSKIRYLVIVLLSINTFAIAKPINKYANDMRALAMKECLDINYEKIGAYKRKQLKDYSFWAFNYGKDHEYSIEGIDALNAFVLQQTGDFYKESLPIKADGAKLPFTAIFARCITFYESKELKEFVKNAKP